MDTSAESVRAVRRPGKATWEIPAARDPRWPFAGLLTLYVVLGLTVLGFNRSPLQVVITVGACCGLDLLLDRLLRQDLSQPARHRLPLSALITGLSLALLLNYAHNSALILLPVLLAIGSKYLIRRQGRHVFNPSLFGVAVTLLVAGDLISAAPAYQWGGTWAASAFLGMAALSLFVFRIGRGWLIGSFLLLYVLQTALRAWIMRWHLPPETLFYGTLTSAPFFLFVFYMLTDPATSPVRPRDQVLTALAIVLADLLLHKLESLYTFYYAAFFVAMGRFLWLAGGDAWRGRARWRAGLAAVARPAGVLAAVGGLCWAAVAAVLPVAGAASDPGFRMEDIPESRSGLHGALGTTLDEVDPRLRHVAKWFLSEGDAVAVGDFDGDGMQDVFLCQPLKRPEDRAALYRNLGGFRFERVPLPCLDDIVHDPARNGLVSGALFADWDNDGDQDLLLMVGFGQCRLLRNMLVETGKAGFVDVTPGSGVSGPSVCLAAQFFDYDRDGRLDLLIGNAMAPLLPDYSSPTPLNPFALPPPEYPGDRRMFHFMHESWFNATNGGQNRLYRNLGSDRFAAQDPAAMGMPETHWSLAIGTGDLNGDGWTDLYVANDFGPDDLYLNRGGKSFQAVRGPWVGSIGRDTYKGMNASLGDVDRDGDLDIYVSNVHHALQPEGSLLWMTGPGDGFVPDFDDEATSRGVLNERRFGWGAAMGDLDLDGWLDIVQANGMVDDTPDHRYPGCPSYWYVNEKLMRSGPEQHAYADRWGDLRGRCIFGREKNRVYLNRGNGARPQFVDVADTVGWTAETNSRGIALADLDNDGRLDAIVTHPFGPPSLFRNVATPNAVTHHWLGIRLAGDGKRCSRDAVGSRVTVTYREHGRTVSQMREVQTANGFSAQGDRRLLFGLGTVAGPVTVRIAWLGGGVRELAANAVDRYVTVRQ